MNQSNAGLILCNNVLTQVMNYSIINNVTLKFEIQKDSTETIKSSN